MALGLIQVVLPTQQPIQTQDGRGWVELNGLRIIQAMALHRRQLQISTLVNNRLFTPHPQASLP